jgi:hypothetical protein
MPITPFLDGQRFDPETIRVMGVAYEMVRAALYIADRSDLVNQVIANKVIELAKAGEANPNLICEQASIYFLGQRS